MDKDLEELYRSATDDFRHHERNMLLSLLSAMFPASLERHKPEETAPPNWRWLVIMDLPGGQCSWHIQDSELKYFDHLPRLAGREWDGQEEETKYKRVEQSRRIIVEGEHG